MPESKTRKGSNKRKAHNRLMLEHNRRGIAKLQQMIADKLNSSPESVAQMLNNEEKSEEVVAEVETTKELVDD